ncbi:hypothetical protein KEJ48_05145 [Candidatus Bathyarchaeota archaeon]|nr:hypothetical protein [Candidatus Bathyarchaeota archaeon]
MPIVYPAKIVEKIKEVIKEVIKPVGFAPSVSLGMEMTVEPSPPLPEVVISFPFSLDLRLYSLRLYLPSLTFLRIISPSLPVLPSEIYVFSLDSGWESLVGGSLSHTAYYLISNPTLPSVTVINVFSPSVYGEVEMTARPDISTSIVVSPTPQAPSEIRAFSTSVGTRLSP